MWNVLKKDLQEFVSVVTGDTKEVLEKVLQKDGEVRAPRKTFLTAMFDPDNI